MKRAAEHGKAELKQNKDAANYPCNAQWDNRIKKLLRVIASVLEPFVLLAACFAFAN